MSPPPPTCHRAFLAVSPLPPSSCSTSSKVCEQRPRHSPCMSSCCCVDQSSRRISSSIPFLLQSPLISSLLSRTYRIAQSLQCHLLPIPPPSAAFACSASAASHPQLRPPLLTCPCGPPPLSSSRECDDPDRRERDQEGGEGEREPSCPWIEEERRSNEKKYNFA